MSARSPAAAVAGRPDRAGRDRLEILTALISGPSFDPLFRPDVIKIPRRPPGLPVGLRGRATASGPRSGGGGPVRRAPGAVARAPRARRGQGRVPAARPRPWAGASGAEEQPCRICPDRPGLHTLTLRLCQRPPVPLVPPPQTGTATPPTSRSGWPARSRLAGYGRCRVAVCPEPGGLAAGAVLAARAAATSRDGQPGGAALPGQLVAPLRAARAGRSPSSTPTSRRSGAGARRPRRCCGPGRSTCAGLRPLLRAEIQWGLFVHTQRARPTRVGPGLDPARW